METSRIPLIVSGISNMLMQPKWLQQPIETVGVGAIGFLKVDIEVPNKNQRTPISDKLLQKSLKYIKEFVSNGLRAINVANNMTVKKFQNFISSNFWIITFFQALWSIWTQRWHLKVNYRMSATRMVIPKNAWISARLSGRTPTVNLGSSFSKLKSVLNRICKAVWLVLFCFSFILITLSILFHLALILCSPLQWNTTSFHSLVVNHLLQSSLTNYNTFGHTASTWFFVLRAPNINTHM